MRKRIQAVDVNCMIRFYKAASAMAKRKAKHGHIAW